MMSNKKSFDHLVYLRIHEGCNIVCSHCFIPENPKRMTIEQVRNVPDVVATFAEEGKTIHIQWHGGEPTLVGTEWLDDAISAINGDTRFVWEHDIQTNLITYSKEWGDLYKRHFNGRIGVSYDPEIRFLKKNVSGNDYETVFNKNLSDLIRDGIVPSVTLTTTRQFFSRFSRPFSLVQWAKEHNIQFLHIERLTRTGRANENWSKIGVSNLEYSSGMARLCKEYGLSLLSGEHNVRISPFDDMFLSLTGTNSNGCWTGYCDNTFHTIDAFGYKRGCTAITSSQDFGMANVKFFPIKDIGRERASRLGTCQSCEHSGLCAGGCLAGKMDDGSGECFVGRGLLTAAREVVDNLLRKGVQI